MVAAIVDALHYLVSRQMLVPVEQDTGNHHALLGRHDSVGFQQAAYVFRAARSACHLTVH
jgi:hypothetical protein